ncbi:hypothetical protein GF339_19255 [candidate division KSB3 bacterium]|uniref:OmpA-like domain-containing protein n=1 Tax=candidate division KSB3 bacterium TaxID=2044937 RepID=A0A9D5Q7C4_9BACT|nr:hypothetical protein [candidate division KSB3 bacterium]MBD3326730.1 hypothetical protein [candidate division KSB3 bacterium]
MQHRIWWPSVMCFLIGGLLVFGGCAPAPQSSQKFTLTETTRKVDEARDHYTYVVRIVPDKPPYAPQFDAAHTWLITAEDALKIDQRVEAVTAAGKSLDASREILQHYYSGDILPGASQAKATIQTILEHDPDDPIRDFLPVLDQMEATAAQTDQGQRAVTIDQIRDDIRQFNQIQSILETRGDMNVTLETDISFAKGEYRLSEAGKAFLQTFVETIIASHNERLRQYPGHTMIIKIKVVGYTDELGFREGTDLVKTLLKQGPAPVPDHEPERRRVLNQRLSELRATTIGSYLETLLQQTSQTEVAPAIDAEMIGRGETIPPEISPPYPVSDPRRRICNVYTYVFGREPGAGP